MIQEKLTNLTTALETGSEDAIIASYRQSGLGEYGDLDGSVGSLRDQAAYKQGLVEADPTLPVSFIGLVSLNSISPGLDKNSMEVSFTLERTDYGVDAEGAPREYKTVEDWTWILEREDTVAGWSDGGTRSNWSIAQETLENLNDVKE